MTTVVLASRNPHKLLEISRILDEDLAEIGAELVNDDGPEPVEDGLSFEANALIKARDAAERTGRPAIADDSGIAVDALGGSPGIFSARWSGPERDASANVDLLLWQLHDVAESARGAMFVAAAALVVPDGRGGFQEEVVRGEWPGTVLRERRGEHGFGYDPIFLPQGSDRSAAELSDEEKDAVSHRRRAFTALGPALRTLLRRS